MGEGRARRRSCWMAALLMRFLLRFGSIPLIFRKEVRGGEQNFLRNPISSADRCFTRRDELEPPFLPLLFLPRSPSTPIALPNPILFFSSGLLPLLSHHVFPPSLPSPLLPRRSSLQARLFFLLLALISNIRQRTQGPSVHPDLLPCLCRPPRGVDALLLRSHRSSVGC